MDVHEIVDKVLDIRENEDVVSKEETFLAMIDRMAEVFDRKIVYVKGEDIGIPLDVIYGMLRTPSGEVVVCDGNGRMKVLTQGEINLLRKVLLSRNLPV